MVDAAEHLGSQQIQWTFTACGNPQQDDQDNNIPTGDWLDPATQPSSPAAVLLSHYETCFPGHKQVAFLRRPISLGDDEPRLVRLILMAAAAPVWLQFHQAACRQNVTD